MALFDSVDLLARTVRLAKRPSSDEDITSAQWYLYLADAQLHWMGQIAVHRPDANITVEQMTTSDAGLTYTTTTEPLANTEIRATRTGVVLIAGPDWSDTADYVDEGQTIRFPGGRARTFASGPWARYVKTPGALDAGVAPVMKPTWARRLLPPHACYLYAMEGGGVRSPDYYHALEQRIWSGDPDEPGDTGILGMLKTAHFTGGMASVATGGGMWYDKFRG